MSLTVPKAGVIGGATASPRFEADQTGDMMAQFGQRMFEIGTQIKADRLDRQMKRAQVDMTRDLGEARIEFDQMGDPDQIDELWPQRVAEIRERHRANLDPENAETFDLAYDDLANRQGFAIGRRAIDLRQSQRMATWEDYRTVAMQQAVLVDADTREALYRQGDEQVDSLVANGIMTPQAAAEEKRRFREQAQNAIVIDQVSNRPDEFLQNADAGEYGYLPPEEIARYRQQATSNIAAAEAKAIRQAELDAKEQATQIGKRLGEISQIADAGRVAVDETFLNLPAVQAHPDYPKAMAAIALRNERADLPFMTPQQLDGLIREEEGKAIDAPFRAERLKVLTEHRDAAAQGWGHDAIAHAGKTGFRVPAMPDIATADPAEIGAAIQQRQAFAEGLREGGYTGDRRAAPLSLDEQEDLKAALSVDADPARRAELVKSLTVSGATGLIADPALQHVGGLLAAGGSDALGRSILKGQQVLARDNVVLPPLADRLDPVFSQIGTLFADSQDGPATQASVIAAADALYAERQRKVDPTAPINETAYKQALHEVMGGTGTYDGDTASGGVATIAGRPTILPMGLSKRQVERAAEMLFRDLNGRGAGGGPTADPGEKVNQGLASLRQMSINGSLPTIGGEVVDADDWRDAEFVSTGPDEYQMVLTTQDGPITAIDSETGDPFVFSLSRLARRYGQ